MTRTKVGCPWHPWCGTWVPRRRAEGQKRNGREFAGLVRPRLKKSPARPVGANQNHRRHVGGRWFLVDGQMTERLLRSNQVTANP